MEKSTEPYVPRRLVGQIGREERHVTERELPQLGFPQVIVGDPGMGKTRLTENLAAELGAVRVAAGTFARTADLERFRPNGTAPIIIDGLDELATSSGASAVDQILTKLSLIGYPNFVLSCRAADWNGSTDRHKILQDYAREPIVLRLEAFSRRDAEAFLQGRRLDAAAVLQSLDRQGLDEFYTNPLTLSLIAVIAESNQGLPSGRAELLEQASRILVRENNPLHKRDPAAQAPVDDLLDGAGAVFAHLLLSGAVGISDRPAAEVLPGFVSANEIASVSPLGKTVMKTRLFRCSEEDSFVPYHRVIAEFLGGRWIAGRLDEGLSERRALSALTFAGGVPTALRGLHAWFGHFAPRLTDACIRADPYGALRYGDPEKLPLEQARLLLHSLGNLANEDPYFRSEDWGNHALKGLVRPELKQEIVDVLKSPERHLHLSTLILEALPDSTLTKDIVPELSELVRDETASRAERYNAAEALSRTLSEPDRLALIRALNAGNRASQRLGLQIMGLGDPNLIDAREIADALLQCHGVFQNARDADHVAGLDYRLLRKLSPEHAGRVLDVVSERIRPHLRGHYCQLGYAMASATGDLLTRALDAEPEPAADRLWRWVRCIEGERGLDSDDREKIALFFSKHVALRRAVQNEAFRDTTLEGAPWMAIVMALPHVSRALAVTPSDTAFFLQQIAHKASLSDHDRELWFSLLRASGGHKGFPSEVEGAAAQTIVRHPELQPRWDELVAPPPQNEWEKRETQRRKRAERERRARIQKSREALAAVRDDIEAGKAFGALVDLSRRYLDRFYDLEHKVAPLDRLNEWIGPDLTSAALAGFIAALFRRDIPTVEQIAENHARGRRFNAETVLVCGIAECLRTGRALKDVPRAVLKSALASWRDLPDNSEKLGVDVRNGLESAVFTSDDEIESFLSATITPAIREGQEYVPGLYELCRDERYANVAGRLSLRWLTDYPLTKPNVQKELIDAAIKFAPRADFRRLARERAGWSALENPDLRPLWMGALFAVDLDASESELRAFSSENPPAIWALRSGLNKPRDTAASSLAVRQSEFLVNTFASMWPPVEHPAGGWSGDQNPWDATDFLRGAINALGANASEEAGDALDRLATDPRALAYRDQIKHVRAAQKRLRRDTQYQSPSVREIRSLLAAEMPRTIDDLRAYVIDALQTVENRIRNSDTDIWEAFWKGDAPLDEDACRNRLVDLLQGHIAKSVHALPETRMPEEKRADIGVFYNELGLPVEAKGQWNRELWSAPSKQLIERYSRDHRAQGRGIYLVFWFGPVSGKSVRRSPEGSRPDTPATLRNALLERLSPKEREHIEVMVLDLSRPGRTR